MEKTLPYFIRCKDKSISFVYEEIKIDSETFFIGFPKLIPSKTKTDISIDDQFYTRGKDYSDWFKDDQNEILKKYIKHVEMFDADLFCFSGNDIEKIYHPLEFENNKGFHHSMTQKVREIISKACFIPIEDIGVEGSTLLGYYSERSDIDLIIYGLENSKKLGVDFHTIRRFAGIRLYQASDYSELLNKRKNIGFGDNSVSILTQELRRFYGFIESKRFSVICVLKSSDKTPIDNSRRIKYQEYFQGEVEIVSDIYSEVIPSFLNVIEKKTGKEMTLEIHNHYGINQARKGESFNIKADKYIDLKTKEEILIISFWSHSAVKNEQMFSLIP